MSDDTRDPFGRVRCTGKIATCQCPAHWGASKLPDELQADDAKRLSDICNLHLSAGGFDVVGKWFRVRLADGTTDDANALYDSREEAIRSVRTNPNLYLFQFVPVDGITPREAAMILQWARAAYDAGMTPTQTEGAELITPLPNEQRAIQLRQLQRMAGYN